MIDQLLPHRFTNKVFYPGNGCWEWKSTKDENGYGRFKIDSKTIHAHKYSYESFFGLMSISMESDHLCLNKSCVNPDHIEAVTHAENTKRAFPQKAICINGHIIDYSNTIQRSKGNSICKLCLHKSQAAYDKRRRAKSRSLGLCIQCHTVPAKQNRSKCIECAFKSNTSGMESYRKRRKSWL